MMITTMRTLSEEIAQRFYEAKKDLEFRRINVFKNFAEARDVEWIGKTREIV